MKKINIAITGCMGRMGHQIIKSVKQDKNFKLVALTETKKIKKESRLFEKERIAGKISLWYDPKQNLGTREPNQIRGANLES